MPSTDKLARKEEKEFKTAGQEFKSELRGLLVEQLKTEGISLSNDTTARKTFTWLIPTLVIGWLVLVLAIVVASGVSEGFDVPESVLLALIGAVAVNLIGIFGIVLTYLFARREEVTLLKKVILDKLMNE